MVAHWLVCVTQLAQMYAQRMVCGPPLQEHEACCCIAVCRLLEEQAKHMTPIKETTDGGSD